MAEDILYSIKQVAVLLKVHPLTVRRYIREGQLKAVRIGGNVRVPQSYIDAFTENILPTSYSITSKNKTKLTKRFSLNDPIFQLKGRGMSLRGLG